MGLAFKLSDTEVIRLVNKGLAKPLKYFPKGYIKKGYALFENPDATELNQWKKYFIKAAREIDTEKIG